MPIEEKVFEIKYYPEEDIVEHLDSGKQVHFPLGDSPDKISLIILALYFGDINPTDAYMQLMKLFSESVQVSRKDIGEVLGKLFAEGVSPDSEGEDCDDPKCLLCNPSGPAQTDKKAMH